MTTRANESKTERDLVITRVFDAPRDLVFRAWTDPEHLAAWWGPTGYTTPVCRVDPRPGGDWFLCMRSPEGRDIWCGGVYREIVEPERIVCTDYFADEEGNPVDPSYYDMPEGVPAEMLLIVTFEEREGKTTVTMRQSLPESVAREVGAVEGWNQSFDRLAEHLEKVAR